MSISRQNLTLVIVTFKSQHIIDQCIQSIDSNIQIIIVENSKDKDFKNYLEKKYKNVSCILSNDNLGMGSGNNIGIKYAKSDYVLILNPDVLLFKNTIDNLVDEGKQLRNFAIISSISDNKEFPNFSIKKKENINYENNFEVDSVDGYCMLINKKKIKSMFKDDFFFDEKIFMYLENDDLCKRVKEHNEKIFIVPNSKIKHLGARGVSNNFYNEVELSRNWHWSWSKFYFSKKHKGYLYALAEGLPKLLSSTIKFFFYYIIFKKFKSKIYYNRALGLFNSMLNRSSWYRPKID
ncbi:MAG: glycosyltransferase [Candidatus Pelagibacter sp.]